MSSFIAFEFDNNNVKIMEASKKGNLLSILKCVTKNCSGIVDGKIEDVDMISDLIKNELLKNEIKTKRAHFVINSSCVITRKVKLPYLNKESEVLSMIKNEMEQVIPVDLNRYKIIYKIIDVTCENDVKSAFYVIYCLPEELFNNCRILAKKLKLRLKFIDVSFNCLNRIYSHGIIINNSIIGLERPIEAYINISKDFISFCILNKGVNDFSRISIIEKEQTRIELVAEQEASYVFGEFNNSSSYAMNYLLEEISKCIRYYCSIDYTYIINKMYVNGDSCLYDDLCKFLSFQLKTDVEVINNISNVSIEDINFNNILNDYFTLCLSCFTDKNDICFSVNKNIECKYNKKAYAFIIIFFMVTIIVALSFYIDSYLSLKNEIKSINLFVLDENNIKLNNEIEKLKEEINLLENYIEKANKLNKIINKNGYISSQIFREIYYSIPEETKVTSMSVNINSTTLSCVSENITDATLFLYNLRNIDYIYNIYIPGIEVRQAVDYTYYYSIICNLKEVNFHGY